MPGIIARPNIAATAIATPDSAPKTADSTTTNTYWRPRMRPTSLSMESNKTSIVPDRNNNSPIKINNGIEASEVIETVSRTLLMNIGNPAGPIMKYTPAKIANKNAR